MTQAIDGFLDLAEEGEPHLVCRMGDSFIGFPSAAGAVEVQSAKALLHYEGSSPPALIGSYKGYNLVAYGRGVLAAPLTLGPLDLTRKADRERAGILVAATDAQARTMIDDAIGKESPSPKLIGSYKGYNLVACGRSVLAAPLTLGPLDLNQKANRERPGILVAATDAQARALIDNPAG